MEAPRRRSDRVKEPGYPEGVRGAGDALSVGERVAFYRRRRGLTQRELAGLVGRSEEWVSSIERGRREIRRVDRLTEVARALRVTLPDLLGQPVLMEDDEHNDDVPAVRDALMSPRRFSRLLYGSDTSEESPSVEASARYAEQVWFEFQAGRVGRVVAALPALIRTAQQLEDSAGEDRREWGVSARVHHLAATTLSKVGESDLAWIAAERAMHAAEQADDPLVLASAARAGTHAFLATGRFEDALSLGQAAAGWLRDRVREYDPEALSLAGMLYLRTAMAAARRQDRATTGELLREATAAAERLGEDANHWQTGFGPTNVELHRLAAALDLGDVALVVERAPEVVTGHLPVERTASHLVDTARALSMVARDDEALQTLLEAERVAPQLVRHNPAVRETVKLMHRRAPVTGGRRSSMLFGLAERCRAVS
jgi:transcriptional regulator with XRE-family HTH domain